VAITVAFVGSIVSETVAANKGIGHLMLVASSRFEVPLAFAGLLVTSVMGIGMYLVAEVIERRMTGWATRGTARSIALWGHQVSHHTLARPPRALHTTERFQKLKSFRSIRAPFSKPAPDRSWPPKSPASG
jgi:hypothetical protein